MKLKFVGDYPKYHVKRILSRNEELILGHTEFNPKVNSLVYYHWASYDTAPLYVDEIKQIKDFINSKNTVPLEFID